VTNNEKKKYDEKQNNFSFWLNILPSTEQENNIARPKTISYLASHLIFIVFRRLTVVQVPFCSLTKGDYSENLLAVCLCPNK